MPTQQEILDIMLRQRLLDQETGNTRALQARAGMRRPGPYRSNFVPGSITPDELQGMVADSQLRQRMGVDPQAARFRRMLANPAQAAVDPNADTPDDVARKARMGATTYIGSSATTDGSRREVPTAALTPETLRELMQHDARRFDLNSEEGSAAFQARRRREAFASAAANASRAKSVQSAFRRGALSPAAESFYANQEKPVIPNRQAIALAQRIALAQAMNPQHQGTVRPTDAMAAEYFKNNPAVYDAMMKSRAGIEPVDPAAIPAAAPPAVVSGKAKPRGITITPPPSSPSSNPFPGPSTGYVNPTRNPLESLWKLLGMG